MGGLSVLPGRQEDTGRDHPGGWGGWEPSLAPANPCVLFCFVLKSQNQTWSSVVGSCTLPHRRQGRRCHMECLLDGEEWGPPPDWPVVGRGDPKGSLVQGQGTEPHLVRFWRMRGTMLAGGPALARKGCLSSSAAVARWAGSRTSRRSRKPFREGDTCGEVGERVRNGFEHQLHFLLATGPQFPPLSNGPTTSAAWG